MSRVREKKTKAPLPEPEAPTQSDEILDEEVLSFIRAIDEYRKQNNRPFPTWSEILKIVHSLGYKKGS